VPVKVPIRLSRRARLLCGAEQPYARASPIRSLGRTGGSYGNAGPFHSARRQASAESSQWSPYGASAYDHPGCATTITRGQIIGETAGVPRFRPGSCKRTLWALREADLDVATLAGIAGCRPTVASQHLSKLRFAGLVEGTRDGQRVVCQLRGAHVRALLREALFQADHHISGAPVHD
jgi:hypothetical protein